MTNNFSFKTLLSPIILLLLLWLTRLPALDLFPLHNDEGLHLTRAVEVWEGHPFWAISDGKIINHWLIAAFYPQHAPVFVARFATILISLLGLAAGYAWVRHLFGGLAAGLAASLWIASPYLFFFERLAFSDAQAGAWVVVALWSSWRLAGSSRLRNAVLTGLIFAAAVLFKFTAAPYALSVILIVLFAKGFSRQSFIKLLVVVLITAACFAVPLLYLSLRGEDFFTVALGWVGSSSGNSPNFFVNVGHLWAQLIGYGSLGWVVLLLGGILLMGYALMKMRRTINERAVALLCLAVIIPLLVMMLLGNNVLARHYVVALPLLLCLGGAGLGIGLRRIPSPRQRRVIAAVEIAGLTIGIAPFMLTAYQNPQALPLPDDVRYEHITSHSAGYGLREALQDFPAILTRPDLPVIGSMFPDSCRRANFYAQDGLTMLCTDAPGLPQIELALAEHGAVYVLADNAPSIGVDISIVDATATRIAAYPRPGETDANASVVLWLLEKK